MKKCSKCNTPKTLDCFAKHPNTKDRLQSWCKECKAADTRIRRPPSRRNKPYKKRDTENCGKYIREDKANRGCQRCGEKDIICLDHHHLRDKLFGLGGGKHSGHTLDEIKAEIAKCAVLCSNCHRKLHAGRFTIEFA